MSYYGDDVADGGLENTGEHIEAHNQATAARGAGDAVAQSEHDPTGHGDGEQRHVERPRKGHREQTQHTQRAEELDGSMRAEVA